eukprot:TRINITY_DN50312_c0_g1_i1.p2 TRINITY_DN50312_c0_g1~~TRINITY_DN50312_c0_g1_i1.p2  ORF type:complete len:151 (+),score=50.53 TRINITY_DN50312_c0_g1_i1:213-665(+)
MADLEAAKAQVQTLQNKLKQSNDAIFEEQKAKLEYKSKAAAAEKKAREYEKNAQNKVEEMQRVVDEANARVEQQRGVARGAASQIAELQEEVRRLTAQVAGGDSAAPVSPEQGFAGANEISALRAVLKEREQQIQMALNIVGSALGSPTK